VRSYDVDERDMHDPSLPEPLPHLLDELLEDGAADPADDARVRAVLHAIHEQLPAAPDEVTQRRHLARAARVRRQMAAQRQAARLARTAAVAGILVFALAAAGVLPNGLQRTVANAGTVVGVSLPSPSPAAPAGEDGDPQIHEIGDERSPASEDDDSSATGPPPATGPPAPTGQQEGAAKAAAHADDRLPPPARQQAAAQAAQARAEAGPAPQAHERAHEAVDAGPDNGNGNGTGRGNGNPPGTAHAHGHGTDGEADETSPGATARGSGAPDRGRPMARGRDGSADDAPSDRRRQDAGHMASDRPGPGAGNGPPAHARAAGRG
jgi:hypothetical protein